MGKEELDFAKMGGLIPVVIQDYHNNEVLMVGFANEDAWRLTNKTGKVHYWSRKKKRLWMKGEESGHFQLVKEIYLDNDNDSLLIKVKQIGGAVEDGYRSCFYKMKQGKSFVTVGQKVFDPKKVYKNYSDTVVVCIPSGSLYATTIVLFGLAGYQLELRGKRSFKPTLRGRKHIKLVVARSQEIPALIESGQVDVGITGTDMIHETGVSVTDLADLKYNEHGLGPVNWVLAVPKEKRKYYTSLKKFSGKTVSTELINTTKEYFRKHKVEAIVKASVGTTESKAPFFADAIVDLCETGESLRDNGLIPLFTIASSTAHVFAHNHSLAYGWKRREIEQLTKLLVHGTKQLPKNPKRLIKLPLQ